MVFNSFIFLAFFIAVLVVMVTVTAITKNIRVRNVLLLAASYLFYGSFSAKFLLVLLYVTIVSFLFGKVIADSRRKKELLTGAVVLSLLPLLIFKYSSLAMPLGISFFTFQALSYTIDIYRGKIRPTSSVIDFALFVSFFPTILSGPIERARNLIPQFQSESKVSLDSVVGGLSLYVWGVFKKVVVADRLAEYVNWAYNCSDRLSGVTLAVAAIFYSIQIYCDFSGYSDMAIGVARALGFEVMQNFKFPYFAHSIKDFWRRWHISLTSWFTEYVYFSLGGSRVKTRLRWMFNISMVFLLSGIWHGASWNFLIWGLMHAVLYLAEYWLGFQNEGSKGWTRYLKSMFVFLLVTIAWIFFRVEDVPQAYGIVYKIFTDWNGPMGWGISAFQTAETMALLAMFAVLEFLVYKKKLLNYDDSDPCGLWNLGVITVLLLVMCLFSLSGDSFVYFQF